MKFSRNPVSGQVEIYTDEGIYLGIVSTMGDDIGPETAEDGGPGSGNFGHKGRPGKRGGSGPGGGKQYRGGRSDIGYFGSRKDWLNGLSGERQHNAARFIANAKRGLQEKQEKRQKTEKLFETGLLTREEADQAIERQGLKDIRPDMSPEEYAIRHGSGRESQELLGMLKEARSWDDTKDRMLNENLSEEERKVYEALEDSKGSWTVKLGDAQKAMQAQQVHDLLEAKAMGVADCDVGITDEMQYALGTKEKPAPEAKIPKNLEENDAWLESLPQEKQDYILGITRGLGVNPQAFGGDIAMNYAENRMMSRVWNGEEKALWEYRRYLDAKDALIGAKFFKQCEAAADENSTSNIGNLGDKPSIILSEFLNQLAEEQKEENPTTSIGSHGDILESGFLQDKSVPNSAKAAYLQLKSIALGQQTHAVRPDDVAKELHKYMIKRKEIRQEEKEYGPKRERFKQDRAAREKTYQEATSSKQVGEEMRKSGMFKSGSNVSLSRADLKSAQEAAMSYEKVMDRYPFLIGQLYGIDESETGSASTYASCSMRTGGIVHLNASDRYYGNFNKLIESYQNDVNSGYHPAGTNGTSIVTHELGHAMDGFLSMKGINGARNFSTDANAFSGILRRSVLKSLRMTKSMVEKELSRYATKNAYEWFAECFAEGMTSENPRPMAKECMRQLDEILRKEGLINA